MATRDPAGNRRSVAVSTQVALAPVEAFEVFTAETATWFRPVPGTTGTWPHSLRFEPCVGGRVLEVDEDRGEREIGRVLAWEPTPRLLFSFDLDREHGGGADAARSPTEVEVRFEAVAGGTRVSLEHRGWDPVLVTAGDPSLEPYLDRWRNLLSSFEQLALEQVLLEFASVFRDAVSAGDAAFLDRHMTEDAVLVFPGERYLKPEVVATIGGHPPYRDVRFQDPRVVRLGPDTAIVTCHVTGRVDGTPEPFANFESSAYVRHDGVWKLAFLQSTPVGSVSGDRPAELPGTEPVPDDEEKP